MTFTLCRCVMAANSWANLDAISANRSAWVPYVRVNDVQATLDRAVEGGGFVIVAPDPLLLDGNLGIFVDPNGAVTGVITWDYDAPRDLEAGS